jgi:hypothetical protein
MKFNFLDGEVYLNMDKSYKRSLKLKDLGIWVIRSKKIAR